MDNAIIITLISTLGVSIVGTIGNITLAIINNKAKKKAEETNQIEKEIKKDLHAFRQCLDKKINTNILNQDKRFLVQFMDKAEREEEISDEEMLLAFETKKEYNDLGGDSYVDTKWDKLIEKEIIKLI